MGFDYYYQKLNEEHQRIYRRLYHGFFNMNQIVEFESTERDHEQIFEVYFALYFDHPELFYIGPTCSLTYQDLLNGKMKYVVNGEFIANKYIIDKKKKTIDEFLVSFRKKCRMKSDIYIINLWLEWLTKNVRYDINNLMNQNASRVLVDLVGQCSGAANATKLVFDYVGIDTIFIIGDAVDESGKTPHAWNLVKLDGTWYQLDPTWVFGLSQSLGNGKLEPSYNMKSDETFSKDHQWERSKFPSCPKDL